MKERNTVMVVDGGGRGHALVDAYARSPHVHEILAVPGNDLMQLNTEKVVRTFSGIKTINVHDIIELANDFKVDLVDVAQDNAVEKGLVNSLQEERINVVGPTREAGRIEWDKAWAREFGVDYRLPQPQFKVFTTEKQGIHYLKSSQDKKRFIKAAFLAEGKGAMSAENNEEAIERIQELRAKFPEAASTYLIEDWMEGEEFSMFVFSDGNSMRTVGYAQDHKKSHDGDQGENTGGMGAVSPPLVVNEEIKRVSEEILRKTIVGLAEEGFPYKGVIYLGGLIKNINGVGVPHVVEFNARWGDPEAQALLPGIENDLFEVGMAIVKSDIRDIDIKVDDKVRVVVAGVSDGYPENYDHAKGQRVYGLDEAREMGSVTIYGAGLRKEGNIYTAAGGRLFYIVGEGKDVIEARCKAYKAMRKVHIGEDPEKNLLHYRTDIGWRDVERLGSDEKV